MSTRDNVTPGEHWQFDASVANAFDDMLERSIPDYRNMRSLVTALACRHILQGTDVVDMGSSRGTGVAPLIQRFGATVTWHLLEASEPMREVLRERFLDWPPEVVRVLPTDLRTDFPKVRASVVLSVLTLQFVPVEHRHRLLRKVARAILPGGVLILVEKVLGKGDEDEALVAKYRANNLAHGYTAEQIDAKRKALEGVLVPLRPDWNEALLRDAGFSEVAPFWSCLNFAGWVARCS